MRRFAFDRAKSRAVKRKHDVSLVEAQEVFEQTFLVDPRNDDPEQSRAIGWCGGGLCAVIFDNQGEYYHLVTAWKATKEEEQSYAEDT